MSIKLKLALVGILCISLLHVVLILHNINSIQQLQAEKISGWGNE